MYKLPKTFKGVSPTIICISNGAVIPFDPDNTDYANFKRDIEEGAELQDADGNVMSANAAKAFIGTLP